MSRFTPVPQKDYKSTKGRIRWTEKKRIREKDREKIERKKRVAGENWGTKLERIRAGA